MALTGHKVQQDQLGRVAPPERRDRQDLREQRGRRDPKVRKEHREGCCTSQRTLSRTTSHFRETPARRRLMRSSFPTPELTSSGDSRDSSIRIPRCRRTYHVFFPPVFL